MADVDILRALTIPDTAGFRFYDDFYSMTSDGQLTTDRAELIRAEFHDALEA